MRAVTLGAAVAVLASCRGDPVNPWSPTDAPLEGTDDAAVKTAFEKLQASQTKLGEAIYSQAAAADAPGAGAEGAPAGSGSADEDIVDAEIIDEDEAKK